MKPEKFYKIREVNQWGYYHYEAYVRNKWLRISKIISFEIHEKTRSGSILALDSLTPIMKSHQEVVTEQGIGTSIVSSSRLYVKVALADLRQVIEIPVFDMKKIHVFGKVKILEEKEK